MATISTRLNDLREQVMSGAIGNSRDWGGAGVIVGPHPRPKSSNDGFYPDHIHVATKHHRELSWLFEELRTVVASRIDYINKFEFFGCVAATVNIFLEEHGDPDDPASLLIALLDQCMLLVKDQETASEVDG